MKFEFDLPEIIGEPPMIQKIIESLTRQISEEEAKLPPLPEGYAWSRVHEPMRPDSLGSEQYNAVIFRVRWQIIRVEAVPADD